MFSAYALGTISIHLVKKELRYKNASDAGYAFNEWLKTMPGFVLEKWDGYHGETMESYLNDL